MALIRPRLTDHFGIARPQASLDFAIPCLNEDIPLYVDPFLLWKSPAYHDKALHQSLINSFNHVGTQVRAGNQKEAIKQLVIASECPEVGLGVSATRTGKRIGQAQAEEIAELFTKIPRFTLGFKHIEELQLFVDGISKDRISDIACSLLKSFLIDFTQDAARSLQIPLGKATVEVFKLDKSIFAAEVVDLPINPLTNQPLLFVPKHWLRYTPWVNFDEYFKAYCPADRIINPGEELTRPKVLRYNRDNYDAVETFIAYKERTAADCKNDPLFSQIPVLSAKRKLARLLKLKSGTANSADREYEALLEELLPSLLYPDLDFADTQTRTESGVSIRDAIFYNTQSDPFLVEIFNDYGSRQVTFEFKNVAEVEREHITQLNRYMTDELGRFGILVTRHELKSARMRSTIDLWSGQRRCIIALTDADISQMVDLFESKVRKPIDVIKKKYIEFKRLCPV